jgi:hypothetical protein
MVGLIIPVFSIIHQGIVPSAGILTVQGLHGKRTEFRVRYSGTIAKEAVDEHPPDTGLDQRHRPVKSKDKNSGSGIRTDAGQALQLLFVIRKHVAEFFHQPDSESFQGQCPPVVAESLPPVRTSSVMALASVSKSGKPERYG